MSKSGVQQYLDVQFTVMGLLMHLLSPSCMLDDEPLDDLPADVLERLSDLTKFVPEERRNPERGAASYERMGEIHSRVGRVLERRA
jgi:hypothetical protein